MSSVESQKTNRLIKSKSTIGILSFAALSFVLIFVPLSIPILRNYNAIRYIENFGGYVDGQPGVVLKLFTISQQNWLEDKLGRSFILAFKEIEFIYPKCEPRDPFCGVQPITKDWLSKSNLKEIACLNQIKEFNLKHSGISNEALKNISHLTQLQELSLQGTRVTDDGLVFIDKYTSLEKLDLEATSISDEILLRIKRISSLKELDISLTQISDAGLKHLEDMEHLERLIFLECKVSWEAIERLKKKLPNTFVYGSPFGDHSRWP